jgi:IS30 family transposase
MRRSRHHTEKAANHRRISDTRSISERPAMVEGALGRYLLCGSKNSQIATLVERHSRYVMLVKVAGKDVSAP